MSLEDGESALDCSVEQFRSRGGRAGVLACSRPDEPAVAVDDADLPRTNFERPLMVGQASALCNLEKISAVELNLSSCSLGDAAVCTLAVALEGNKTLKVLNLSANFIRERGCEFLSGVLNRCVLTSLDLSSNIIMDNGAMVLAKAMWRNTQIEVLRLANNSINEAGSEALVRSLGADGTSVRVLHLDDNFVGEEAGLLLGRLLRDRVYAPQRICLDNQHRKAIVAPRREKFQLEELGLQSCRIGSPAFALIAGALAIVPNRTYFLNLAFNDCGIVGIEKLGASLQANKSLTDLNLTRCSLGVEGAEILSRALGSPGIVLRFLHIGDNAIEAVGAVAIASALSERHCHLEYLDLSSNNMGDGGLDDLASTYLPYDESLLHLDISSNKITRAGASALKNALLSNTVLKSLFLADNLIGNKGAQSLSKALMRNRSLTELDLKSNGITAEGVFWLAEGLEWNVSLKRFSLRGNYIAKEGAEALARVLSVQETLENLNLMACSIGDDGAKALANALLDNHALTRLDLMSNEISSGGSLALADALKNGVGGPLRSLDVMNNIIVDYAGAALAKSVAGSSLREFDYAQNHLQDEDVEHIEVCLEKNRRTRGEVSIV